MNYKLKLTMPNGEVLETELIDQRESEDGVEQFKRALEKDDDYIEFQHLNGKRTIPRSIFRECYFDVIEVDQPIEQAKPTETTNVGKRVEFDSILGEIEGTIISESNHCYRIKNSDGELWIFKDKCTILEDQPKSNVGTRVIIKRSGESYSVVLESDKEYVLNCPKLGFLVFHKNNCELLPE